MLNRLRWQLTLLYLLVALGLMGLVGLGSYTLLRRYFQDTTDLALLYKVATQFRAYGIPLTSELARAERDWQDEYAHFATVAVSTPTPTVQPASAGEEGGGEDKSESKLGETEAQEGDAYDVRLAPIFTLSGGAVGATSQGANTFQPPISLDQPAQEAALLKGVDWRTLILQDNSRVRLLSYRNPTSNGPTVFQVGRLLDDQEHALSQFLSSLFMMGAISAVLLGLGSWWLAGRSIRPAQEAWDHQQTFVSNASHELRTPLTLIKASAEVGLRNQPDEEQALLLEDIVLESNYMNRLVDDLLLLSRLDTHRLKLERTHIDLGGLLGDTQRTVSQIAAEKGVDLTLGSTGGFIWGDPTRMRQVLLILLDNALRFTPAGGTIHLGASPQGKVMRISVTDNGCGIAPEHIPHIFERFYQVAQPGEAETRNNGLGLSIAKSLIEAQGGKITLESRPGRGTRVTLSMPGE